MLLPIRCFTCGKVIGHLWKELKEKVKGDDDFQKFFEEKGIRRYCCRQVLMTSLDLEEDLLKFKP